MKNKNIVVSGSLVYDRIMDFPGYFKDQILPDKIHILNVSFLINDLKESFGGTAGNIAYNLSLLGEQPKLLGVVGNDFDKYQKWLAKNKINTSLIKKIEKESTAAAYIITDRADNQITGFYPGPKLVNYCSVAERINKVGLAIVSPELKGRMLEYVKIYKKLKIDYIFDPGQQITALTAGELQSAIKGAKVLIGNDYEIQLIMNRLCLNLEKLKQFCEILIITKGEQGSEIYQQNKKIKISPVKLEKILDPTGAGDAYRAGFIYGLVNNWPLEKIGKFASVVAGYAVEKYGTQAHKFTWLDLKKRYVKNYKEILI